MSGYDFRLFTDNNAELDVVKLKEHIASGASNTWNVTRGNGVSETFDNFEAANRYFDATPAKFSASLVLYTRIGTLVQFRFREAKA